MLPRLKISQRLALSYGAVILLLIAMTFLGINKLHTLSATTDDALKDKYPKTILVNQVIADLGVIARAMRNALILTNADQVHEQLADISNASDKMAVVLAELEHRVNDAKGKDLLNQIRIVHSAYIVNQDDFIGLVAAHKMGEAKNLLLVDLYGYQNTYFDLLNKLNLDQGDLMDQASREVGETYRTARNVMYALVAVAALLSVAITYIMNRDMRQKLPAKLRPATCLPISPSPTATSPACCMRWAVCAIALWNAAMPCKMPIVNWLTPSKNWPKPLRP